MAAITLSDIVKPQYWEAYGLEKSINYSRLFRSGAIEKSNVLSSALKNGGEILNFPFVKDFTGGEAGIPTAATNLTINNATSANQIARRLFKAKAWGVEDLSEIIGDADYIGKFKQQQQAFREHQYNLSAFAVLEGVIADNIANDSGDLANVTAVSFTRSGLLDAKGKIGDASRDFVAVVMHSDIYTYIQKNDATSLTTVVDSELNSAITYYDGMEVIVDDNCTKVAGSPNIYTTYALKRGALSFGEDYSKVIPLETERQALLAGGTDVLVSRMNYVIHPNGFSFDTATTVAGLAPTNAELAVATAWDRVVSSAKNSGIVAYKHAL